MSPQRLAHRALQHGVHSGDASLDRLVQRLEAELDQTANAHLRRDQVRLEPVRRVYYFPHAFQIVKRLEVHRLEIFQKSVLEERADRLAAAGIARSAFVQLVREVALVRVAAAQNLVHQRASVLEVRRRGTETRQLRLERARAGLDGVPYFRDLATHLLAEDAHERAHKRVRAEIVFFVVRRV